jgi:hypothetical protein
MGCVFYDVLATIYSTKGPYANQAGSEVAIAEKLVVAIESRLPSILT